MRSGASNVDRIISKTMLVARHAMPPNRFACPRFTIKKKLSSLGKNSSSAVVLASAIAHSGFQRGQTGNRLGCDEK